MKYSTLILLGRSLKVSFAERAAYRGDFLLSFSVTFLLELISPLVTLLIYNSGTTFPGWTLQEAMMIQAVFLIARGVAFPLFFGMVWIIFEQAKEGTFEITLLKPRSPLLLTMLKGIDIEGVGRVLGGVLLFLFTLKGLPFPGIHAWVLFLILLALSVMVLFGFALILTASLFIWIGNGRVIELLESILVFSRYPGSIFASPVQWIFALVVPLSMIALFPAEALMGRSDPLMFYSIPIAFAFFGVGYLFWNRMIHRYAGGGG
jgi:ABC-2 type transport system permease protein